MGVPGMAKNITDRQRAILEFVVECIQENGCPPTIAEIAQNFGLASTNGAFDHVRALQRKGYLERSNKARHISLTDKTLEEFGGAARSEPAEEAATLPLVGRIAAGSPLLADENVERQVHVDPGYARPGNYCLRVEGESMIDAGILDGDLLVVDGKASPKKGDIVVALCDDDATVKYYHPKGGTIELRPANATMEPMQFPASLVAVQGVVVALQRELR